MVAHKRQAPDASADDAPSKAARTSYCVDADGKSHVSVWTAEKKAKLVDHLLGIAVQSAKMDELVAVTGLTKKQLADALCKGKKKNLRMRLIEAAKTMPATG